MPSPPPSEKLRRIEARIARLDVERRAARTADKAERRRRDTHRKILIGGRVLQLARTDPRWRRLFEPLLSTLADQNPKTFEDFKIEE